MSDTLLKIIASVKTIVGLKATMINFDANEERRRVAAGSSLAKKLIIRAG